MIAALGIGDFLPSGLKLVRTGRDVPIHGKMLDLGGGPMKGKMRYDQQLVQQNNKARRAKRACLKP